MFRYIKKVKVVKLALFDELFWYNKKKCFWIKIIFEQKKLIMFKV